MALRFCDSFSHYVTANINQKWSTSAGCTIGSGDGRLAGNALTNGLRTNYVQMNLDSQQTWVLGAAVKILSNNTIVRDLFMLFDSGTLHMTMRINSSGQLTATRNGTQLGSAGTTVLQVGTWYYLEFKTLIDDTVGTYEVRINGATEISGTGQDTRNAATATANQIRFGNSSDPGNNGGAAYDDVYICDTSGSTNNDFLGDVRVEALFPNGNGNSSQFTGSDGNSTDNYLLVDETSPNDDTDYVEDSTVTDKDTYAYTNPTPTTGTVYGVQTVPYARKTDAGTRSIRELARLSTTEIDNGADITLSTSYLYYPKVFETKPGGGAWTLSDVSSAEFGYKVAA